MRLWFRLHTLFFFSSFFCMSVTNESPKHEAINFINQQSQTPAESVYGAKANRCGTEVERRGVDGWMDGWGGGHWRFTGRSLSRECLFVSHVCIFHFFFFFGSCVTACRIAVTCMQTSPSWQTRIGGLERSTAQRGIFYYFFFLVGVCLALLSCACQQIYNIIRVYYHYYYYCRFIKRWSNAAAVDTFRVRAAKAGWKSRLQRRWHVRQAIEQRACLETPFIQRNCTMAGIAHTLHSSSSPVSVFIALCTLSRSARGRSRNGPIRDGPWWVAGTGLETGLTGDPGEVPRSPCVSPASALSLAHLAGGWSSESSRLCATLPVRMQAGAGLLHCKFIPTRQISPR